MIVLPPRRKQTKKTKGNCALITNGKNKTQKGHKVRGWGSQILNGQKYKSEMFLISPKNSVTSFNAYLPT